jgi:tetratricopeptide (TPR) repeat protein
LLRARRQELHAGVAAALERYFADVVERQPELLAHHLTGAGANQRAVQQWLKAGQFAAARSTHLEAVRHFERALALLASTPESPVRDEQEIELQLARGLSLFTTEGFISNSAAQAYTRARELAERHRDARRLVLAIYGEWQGTAASGRVLAGIPLSRTLLELTNSEADSGLRLQAHHSAWTTYLFSAQPITSREHSAIGRRLYDPEHHRSHRLLFGGHDPGVCARNMGAQAEWQLGYPDTALASSADGLALAERIGHPLSLEMALMFKALLHLERGEPESALALLTSAEALVAEQRLAFVIEPQLVHGAALMARGATEDAIASLQAGLRTGVGGRQQKAYGLVVLANALLKHQEAAAALAALKEAREIAEVQGLRQWQAEIHRTEGMVLLYQNKLEEAQREFEEALRFARERNMKGYELRAATDLARLWAEQGRPEQARELLRPIYGWFTEGFDTLDLKEAKALIEELA